MVLKGPSDLSIDRSKTVVSNYPDEWLVRYKAKRYFELDPVAEMAVNTNRPFFWSHGRFLRPFRKPQRLVFDEAREFKNHVRSGHSDLLPLGRDRHLKPRCGKQKSSIGHDQRGATRNHISGLWDPRHHDEGGA